MSVIYQMNASSAHVIERLKAGTIEGLRHVQSESDEDGKPNLWPDGVSDGKATGWFEGDLLIFWGGHDATVLFHRLYTAGIILTYVG